VNVSWGKLIYAAGGLFTVAAALVASYQPAHSAQIVAVGGALAGLCIIAAGMLGYTKAAAGLGLAKVNHKMLTDAGRTPPPEAHAALRAAGIAPPEGKP
jgi:hypothetical protein